MMHIGDLQVIDSYVVYQVEPWENTWLECETLQEAEELAATWGVPVLRQKWYGTEWEPLT